MAIHAIAINKCNTGGANSQNPWWANQLIKKHQLVLVTQWTMPTSLNAPHVSFPLLHTYIEHPHFNKMKPISSGYVFKLSLRCILCFTSTLNSMLSLFVNSNNNTKYKSKEERRENLHWVEFIYYVGHFWEIFFYIYTKTCRHRRICHEKCLWLNH